MIRDEYYEQKICRDHNILLEFENPDKSKPNLYACSQCIIDYYKLTPIQQMKQSNEGIIKQFEQQLGQNSQIWNITIHSLISLREAFTISIKIIENIIDAIRNQIQQTMNEFKTMNINHMQGIKQAHDSYLQTQLNHQRNFIQQIDVLKQNSSIDRLIQGLNEINLQKLNYNDQKQKIKIVEIQMREEMDQVVPLNSVQQLQAKRYEYQLIPIIGVSQVEQCLDVAFNYDGSIIVAICTYIIKVFQFTNSQLKEVQSLKSDNQLVSCLQFMKKSNQFISGSWDNTIKIWQVNNQNQYINIQTLQEHKSGILSIIINSNDDLIVSGSRDKSVIFWGLNGNKWQFDQQIECSSSVYILSFNDSNTKLIACERNKLIQVFEQQGKVWIISQKIQVEQQGVRQCFISDDQFVFLPCKSQYLHFYKLDSQTNKFEKQLEVEVRSGINDFSGFRIKFIKSKNLLIVKNCGFVNILRCQENFAFIQAQSIKFPTYYISGDVSEDGNFMVTFDNDAKEYQVRQLKEIQ